MTACAHCKCWHRDGDGCCYCDTTDRSKGALTDDQRSQPLVSDLSEVLVAEQLRTARELGDMNRAFRFRDKLREMERRYLAQQLNRPNDYGDSR